jgi:outer membrane protein OmpA-like peptidoglycan-associated protein
MRLATRIVCGLVSAGFGYVPAGDAQTDPSSIRPIKGLVITSTGRSTLVSAQSTGVHAYNDLDQETWTSVTEVTPQDVSYRYHVAAPSNQQANADAKKFIVMRTVRRADIEQSTRMTLLCSTTDPLMYGGQTFAETSAKTLQQLKAGSEVAFVLGVNGVSESGLLDAVAGQLSSTATKGPLGNLGGAFSLMNSGRDYYRGTLHRVEPGPVKFSVLINGVRTTVPAMHAAGTFSYSSKPAQHAEFWWLDNSAYPLTLKWVFGNVNSLVTRIDWPPDTNLVTDSAGTSGIATFNAKLEKSCRAEMSGIYFNTGSAQILEESQPTLAAVAKLIKQSKFTDLTIEGHTDNMGTAAYNQDLSERRAAAVRQALVAEFGIAPARLTAKGYGLTRPVETNATPEGRSHNRRVELSRRCGGTQ